MLTPQVFLGTIVMVLGIVTLIVCMATPEPW